MIMRNQSALQNALHLIYIPGLGDTKVTAQRKAVSAWKLWGAEAELFQINWADKEAWETKFERLLARIDYLAQSGKAVGLVGASAGAAAVINAYAARKNLVVGCVLIAGKINRPSLIGQHIQKENPAFVTSANDCQKAILTLNPSDRIRIQSRYALADETVHKPDSRIPGAHNKLVLSVGHALTIITQITIGAPSFIRFLRLLRGTLGNQV